MNQAQSRIVIRLDSVSKDYRMYVHDVDRIKEIITGRPCHQLQSALREVSIEVNEGEVVGVVGRNGAGKSTLLKMLANTMRPSTGIIEIRGRVAAMLELGASFHPEMTGHENIYLYCSIQGLTREQTDAIYEEIVEFSGIREFIHRQVKTYSSGMFVRLAFSAAVHVDPDILIIDEALSVGDGIFARRSFERIMQFKEAGKTIFFCSHSLYQVEALCDRVIWIEEGKVMEDGAPAEVISAYSSFLNRSVFREEEEEDAGKAGHPDDKEAALPRVTKATVKVDGKPGRSHVIQSGRSELEINIRFSQGKGVPMPSIGIVILSGEGVPVASAGSVQDGVFIKKGDDGLCETTIIFPQLPLLKGRYLIDIYLMCERAIHIYERVKQVADLNVRQEGLARGYVNLPHLWR